MVQLWMMMLYPIAKKQHLVEGKGRLFCIAKIRAFTQSLMQHQKGKEKEEGTHWKIKRKKKKKKKC